jgi:L-lysine 6-transaminase
MTDYTHPSGVHETIGRYMLADGFPFVVDMDKSHGSWLVDKRNGKEYLDLFSCFASMPIGWNHPDIVSKKDEFGRVAMNNVTNSDIYTSEMAWAVDTIARIAKPDCFNHQFFIAGGGLAVENTLKAAFDWKVQKNWKEGNVSARVEKGQQIAHFKDAFHGRTGYTMSLTNTAPVKTKWFAQFKWPRITNPVVNFPVDERETSRVQELEDQAISEIHQSAEQNPHDIAGIIIEPIQGEGGDNHFRPEFFVKLRKAADEIDAMLIFDEVQAGVGITGKMYGYQCADIKPDAIAFGKKMQVCGMFVGPKVDENEDNVFTVSSRINSTWGGNLIDMVRGAHYLEIIEKEHLVQNAATVGDHFIKGLEELYDDDRVTNVRGRGLMCAFTLPDGATRDAFRSAAMDLGCFTLTSGSSSIRFRPMLSMTKDEADEGIRMLHETLRKI